jgi:small subunit ribosomal protein S19
MARSSKKGPYVDSKLLKKVAAQAQVANKQPIKTWARASQIAPEFVGQTFLVHNGRKFIEVFVSEEMVGHRLGEFAPTRTFHGHGKMVKRLLTKT